MIMTVRRITEHISASVTHCSRAVLNIRFEFEPVRIDYSYSAKYCHWIFGIQSNIKIPYSERH